MFEFYSKIIHRALKMTFDFLGFKSYSAVFKTIFLWCVSSIVIYVFFNSLINSRMEAAISALIGLVFSFFLIFMVALIVSPAKMYSELIAKNKEYQCDIDKAVDSESKMTELSSLYYEGKAIYHNGFNDEEEKINWVEKMQSWVSFVEERIVNDFSVTTLHRFRDTGNGFHYSIESMNRDLSIENTYLLSKYSSYLSNLNEIVLYERPSPEVDLMGKYGKL